MGTVWLPAFFIFFCVQHKKETHTGLERHKGGHKWWQTFHFRVNYAFSRREAVVTWTGVYGSSTVHVCVCVVSNDASVMMLSAVCQTPSQQNSLLTPPRTNIHPFSHWANLSILTLSNCLHLNGNRKTMIHMNYWKYLRRVGTFDSTQMCLFSSDSVHTLWRKELQKQSQVTINTDCRSAESPGFPI